jgi:hypothetical protein
MEKSLKRLDVRRVKKTELRKLEEKHNPEMRNLFSEIENMNAILPELIASVKKGKDLDLAAYFVGLRHGIILNCLNDTEEDEPEQSLSKRIADVFFTPYKTSPTKH